MLASHLRYSQQRSPRPRSAGNCWGLLRPRCRPSWRTPCREEWPSPLLSRPSLFTGSGSGRLNVPLAERRDRLEVLLESDLAELLQELRASRDDLASGDGDLCAFVDHAEGMASPVVVVLLRWHQEV